MTFRTPFGAVLATALFLSFPTFAAPPDPTPDDPGLALPRKVRGEEAIQLAGAGLGRVAAAYGMPQEKLVNLLRKDQSLWLDEKGRLLFVCNWPLPPAEPTAQPKALEAGPFPQADTFQLHSRPGSTKVIYLDFDGHDASGTSWGGDAICRPFDLDGNAANFSSTERDRIQYIWQRVSEDYAHYDVDVTTEDPGIEALRKTTTTDQNYGIRVAIGGAGGDWFGSAGGVAYVGNFNANSDTPCWVFPKSLGDSEKNIAEAISHEVGHTLTLLHDGKTDGTEYYGGQGNWAPIMGVGYSKPITHWSKGEYNLANNKEDDLAEMLTEGIAYRTDDHGGSIATATRLAGTTFSAEGVIERTTDVDYFSIENGAGPLSITVSPAPRGPNVHILLSLYEADGGLILTRETADTTAGTLAVSVTTNLPLGLYYFSVDGIGSGDPLTTGYSDYGSIGEYTVSGTTLADGSWVPIAAGTFEWTNTANWASARLAQGPGANARLISNLAGEETVTLDYPVVLQRLFIGDSIASHGFTVEPGMGGSLTFAALSGSAGLSKTNGILDKINVPITLRSSLLMTNTAAAELVLNGTLSGTNGITKYGPGTIRLSGPSLFTGASIIAAGKLAVDLAQASSAAWEVRAGATLEFPGGFRLAGGQVLRGNGTVSGDVELGAGAQLVPGSNFLAGTLTFLNTLVLGSNSVVRLDLGSTTNSRDYLSLNNLVITNPAQVELSFPQVFPASPAAYLVAKYSGSLIGDTANLTLAGGANRYSFTWDTSVPGELWVNVTGGPADPLTWKGDGSLNRWDVLTSSTWTNDLGPQTFAQLDAVTFNDSGAAWPTVTLLGTLQPASITVTSSVSYSWTGTGKITGATGVTKDGTGMLTLGGAHDYTGVVEVRRGTLKPANASALGSTTGNTVIQPGARLDVNGLNLGAEPVLAGDAGPDGLGAIVNGGASQINALRFVTLSTNTTFGGSGRWDIRANPTGALVGNNFDLTKVSGNEIWLVDLGFTGLKDIRVNSGLLGIQGSTTLGYNTGGLTLAPGTTLALWGTDTTLMDKKFVLDTATLRSDTGNNVMAGSLTLTNTGTNVVQVANTLELQMSIGGTGSLRKTGSGILGLSASNYFTGTALVGGGTLRPGNAAALGAVSGSTIIQTGGRLDVNGQNLGAEPVVVQGTGLGTSGAIVNYGSSQQNALRFLTLSGNTTLGGISRWDVRANPTGSLTANGFNLTKTGPNEIWLVGLGSNDLGLITVSEGMLGLQNNTSLGNTASNVVINSAGSLGFYGSGSNSYAKVFRPSGGRLYSGAGTNYLNGAVTLSNSNRFDVVSGSTMVLNGAVGGSGLLNKITAGVLVLANNNTYSGGTLITAGTMQVGNNAATGTLGSGGVTNNGALVFNRSGDYTIANAVTGTGTTTKLNTGALVFSGSNSYSGLTTVSAGTLRLGNAAALGDTNGATTVASGATLDINGLAPDDETLTLNGSGVGAAGALINSSPIVVSNAVRYVVLAGNTTIGGTGRFDLRDPGAGGASSLTGNGYRLTKTGVNQVWLANLGNTGLGDIVVSNGTLVIQGSTTLGAATNTVWIEPAGVFASAGVTTALSKQVQLRGGRWNHLAANATLTGVVTLTGIGNVDVATATTLTWAGPVGGAGGFSKLGPGNLTLSAANTFAGPVFVSGGTLNVANFTALGNSSYVQVEAGATLNVSSIPSFVLGVGRELRGNGNVSGAMNIAGAVAPGTSGVGRLNFNSNLGLNGTTRMELTKSGAVRTNDFLSVASVLSLGGTLQVTSSGEALAAGDTFDLFEAASVIGSFSAYSLPPLAPGLAWDLSSLATNGRLTVVEAGAPQLGYSVMGTNLELRWNSYYGLDYVVETATNLAEPAVWLPVSTNPGTGGTMSFTAGIDPMQPWRFFRMSVF
jgi:autotransporter-associated beta strand protein